MALDDIEIARRINAAMAYASFEKGTRQVREDLVALLNVSVRTLDRMLGKGIRSLDQLRHAHWEELRIIADYCELPPEFFSADFDLLPVIVPEGGTIVARATGPGDGAFPVPQVKRVPMGDTSVQPVDASSPPSGSRRSPRTPPPARKASGGPDRGKGASRTPASSRRSR